MSQPEYWDDIRDDRHHDHRALYENGVRMGYAPGLNPDVGTPGLPVLDPAVIMLLIERSRHDQLLSAKHSDHGPEGVENVLQTRRVYQSRGRRFFYGPGCDRARGHRSPPPPSARTTRRRTPGRSSAARCSARA
jgi:hypothetical protein